MRARLLLASLGLVLICGCEPRTTAADEGEEKTQSYGSASGNPAGAQFGAPPDPARAEGGAVSPDDGTIGAASSPSRNPATAEEIPAGQASPGSTTSPGATRDPRPQTP